MCIFDFQKVNKQAVLREKQSPRTQFAAQKVAGSAKYNQKLCRPLLIASLKLHNDPLTPVCCVQILRRSWKKSLTVASPHAIIHTFIIDKTLCRGSPSSSWPGAGYVWCNCRNKWGPCGCGWKCMEESVQTDSRATVTPPEGYLGK